MKFVMVQWLDATDISALAVNGTVTVGAVPGGTIVAAGSTQNPPPQVLLPHTHVVPAIAGSLNLPEEQSGPPVLS